MFLPPVDPGTPWTNDFSGDAQTPHPWLGNVTFELIDQVYRSYTDHGFVPVSYFNLNHYGKDLVLPPLGRPDVGSARRGAGGGLPAAGSEARRTADTPPAVTPPGGPWWNDSAAVLQRLFPRAPVTHGWSPFPRKLACGFNSSLAPWYPTDCSPDNSWSGRPWYDDW